MADLGDPWTGPKPPALGPKVTKTHLVGGDGGINREMFTRWLKLLSLMWFLVFQWSPQRGLCGRFHPVLNCESGWMPSRGLGRVVGKARAGSWERQGSLQAAPDHHYLG